jgi:hypothetical protein
MITTEELLNTKHCSTNALDELKGKFREPFIHFVEYVYIKLATVPS